MFKPMYKYTNIQNTTPTVTGAGKGRENLQGTTVKDKLNKPLTVKLNVKQ